MRAIPGAYTVRLTALSQTVEQPLTVRLDPRVTASAEDMQVWQREARRIEQTDCSLDRAVAEYGALDQQLGDLEAKTRDAGITSALSALRTELRPVVLGLRGDPKDPGHVNLPGRINWLTIQVGNYSGRPTAAQMEWIAKYAGQTDTLLRQFEAIKSGSLTQLNARLKAAGLPEVNIPRAGSMAP